MRKTYFGLLFIITGALFPTAKAGWAEQTLQKLTLEEKVGQLFMVRVTSEKNITHLIKEYHIGGLIFFNGSVKEQAALTNTFQSASKLPLLISQDSEWGLNMWLEDGMRFPKNMTLGAISDESLLYECGKEIGRQCRAIGVHVNFAPVVDINSNPNNPIIGVRSFGSCKEDVARKGAIFTRGLQDAGCIACAKHFPGHGDTSVDSHLDLPLVAHAVERLYDEGLYPFKILINSGIDSIMIAHLSIPALDSSGLPASISRSIVTELLRQELGFDGLIFTDAMSMRGVTKLYEPREAALRAIVAGNDVLLCPLDVESSIQYLVQAVRNGQIDESELDTHVLRILQIKEKLGLHNKRLIEIDTIDEKIHSSYAKDLKKRLYQSAVTIVRDEKNIIPLENNKKSRVVIIDVNNTFALKDYQDLHSYDTIVLRMFKISQTQGKYGKISEIDDNIKSFLDMLEKANKQIVIMLCTSPYALQFLPDVPTIIAYEDDPDAVEAAIDVLWGESVATGKLPIDLTFFKESI